jgi:stage II sporulation protein D
MKPERIHEWLRRFAPALPVAMLLVACGAASVMLSSCRQSEPVSATPSSPLRLNGVPTVRVRLTPASVESAVLSTNGPYSVIVDGRVASKSALRLPPTTCARVDGRWRLGMLTVEGAKLTLAPNAGCVQVGPKLYRGTLVLLADGPARFFVHNHVDMESYLASVVAKELYPDFHPEAYRAQAIAARTYALYEMATRGRSGSFDVWDSQRSQVYGGMLAETDRSWQSVRGTHACVLAYGSPGNERIFLAQFSACNGGYVNGADVIRQVSLGEKIAPLAGGQKDGDGRACPHYTWGTVMVRKDDLFRALAARYESIRKLGGIQMVRIRQKTHYGRAVWLDIVGPGGQVAVLRAEDLRLALLRSNIPQAKGLYSMNCQVRDMVDCVEFAEGRGFGHGVGLSQWGAEEKARRGVKAREILAFYYPGAVIFRAY